MQKPICYVSHALLDAEMKYSMIEKMALVLVISTRKLRPYFQANVIVNYGQWAVPATVGP